MADDERFMRRAIELGRTGMTNRDGGPFGAVVVKDGAVVGEGWNRVVGTNDPTAHGEIVALRDAGRNLGAFDLSGCDLYTTGEPCPMCLAAVYWARIDRYYFGFRVQDAAAAGFDDRSIFDEMKKDPARRTIRGAELLRAEALALLHAYTADPNRPRY